MKIHHNTIITGIVILLLFLFACKKKDTSTPPDPTPQVATPNYKVPTSYNAFTNVDHSESTILLGMMSELSTEIAKGTGLSPSLVPSPLNAQHLLNLFGNQNNEFVSDVSYNTTGLQIKNNCSAISQAQLENFIDTLVKVSNASTRASDGIAGLGLSLDATPRRFLLTTNGENYSQLLFKNLMGDLILYQITRRVADNTLDNSVNLPGKNYTALEHNWDIAFGYFGVPDSFPAVKTPVKYWGSYSTQIDNGLGCNKMIMDAFLKGRAAISNKDLETKNKQAAIIIAEFDRMTAGAVIQEYNEIQQSITAGDQVKIVSQISEAKAFVMSMRNNKNAGRIITDAQITSLLALFPHNQWHVSPTDLNNIKSTIAAIYGFTAQQLLDL